MNIHFVPTFGRLSSEKKHVHPRQAQQALHTENLARMLLQGPNSIGLNAPPIGTDPKLQIDAQHKPNSQLGSSNN